MQRRFVAYNGKNFIIVKLIFMAVLVYFFLAFIYKVVFKTIFDINFDREEGYKQLLNFGVNTMSIPKFDLLDASKIFKYSLNYFDNKTEQDYLNELYLSEKLQELEEEIMNGK